MIDSKKDDFQTIIFFNEDLREEFKNWKINYIEYHHFKTTSRDVVAKASLVLYIDSETRETKIIKSRWGNDGVVAK